METPALVFIGFMGAGKTTGARAAAAALGVRAVDTDRELEQRLGTSIEDYFASHGERAFREAEEDVVAEVLETVPAPVTMTTFLGSLILASQFRRSGTNRTGITSRVCVEPSRCFSITFRT